MDTMFRIDTRTPIQKLIEGIVGNGIPVKDKVTTSNGNFDNIPSIIKKYAHIDDNMFDLYAHLARMDAATTEDFTLKWRLELDAKKLESHARNPITPLLYNTRERVIDFLENPFKISPINKLWKQEYNQIPIKSDLENLYTDKKPQEPSHFPLHLSKPSKPSEKLSYSINQEDPLSREIEVLPRPFSNCDLETPELFPENYLIEFPKKNIGLTDIIKEFPQNGTQGKK